MGKTKIKTIDDSAPEEEKKPKPQKVKKPEDALVAKLKEELGITEEKKQPVTEKQTTEKLKSENLPAGRQDRKLETDNRKRGKKYQAAKKQVENTAYSIPEAVELVKKTSYSSFTGSLEAHINTSQKNLRGFVSLPFLDAKSIKILVFGPETNIEGVTFGNDQTIEEILKGKTDFDVLISTPQWMPKLAKAAKILGPKGLMPNPKNGTISPQENLKKTVESFKTGKTEFKTEPKGSVIHLKLGSLNQPNEELVANIKSLLICLGKSKIEKVVLASTMGPGVKLSLESI